MAMQSFIFIGDNIQEREVGIHAIDGQRHTQRHQRGIAVGHQTGSAASHAVQNVGAAAAVDVECLGCVNDENVAVAFLK